MHRATSCLLAFLLPVLTASGRCCPPPCEVIAVRAGEKATAHVRTCCCKQCARRGEPTSIAPTSGCQGPCHDICQYVAPERVQFEERLVAAPLEAAVSIGGCGALLVPTRVERDDTTGFSFGSGTLRLHLRHQILLI